MRNLVPTNYPRRLALALLASLILHVVALMFGVWRPEQDRVLALNDPSPIILNLQHEAQTMKRLIDPGEEASEPVEETDLISDHDSKAQDLVDGEGDPAAPAVDKIGEFERMAPEIIPVPPAPPVQPMLQQQTPEQVEEAQPEEVPEAPEQKKDEEESGQEITSGAVPTQLAMRKPTKEEKEQEKKEPDKKPREERAADEVPKTPEVAQQMPLPPEEPLVPVAPAQGRTEGGAPGKGFLSFEAKQHEMAPYMRALRKKVEGRWLGTLELKYNGVAKTSAVIDCSIAPDGKLVYVKIVDAGNSIGYAALCKEAIQKAAPFAPFPFEVPDIYRTKNLEIRWTFSFL